MNKEIKVVKTARVKPSVLGRINKDFGSFSAFINFIVGFFYENSKDDKLG